MDLESSQTAVKIASLNLFYGDTSRLGSFATPENSLGGNIIMTAVTYQGINNVEVKEVIATRILKLTI